MKEFIKRILRFFGRYGHRMFTFCVGLAFIGGVLFSVGLVASRIYRTFVPDDIYTDPGYKTSLYGGSVYEIFEEEAAEEGTPEFFEDYISNLIRQDMPDFDDPSEINDDYLISFGLWQAIKLNNVSGVYTFDSRGNFRVPKSDVDMYSLYCFDYARKLNHHSVDICSDFDYNMLNGTYKIKSAGVSSYLVPDVLEVEAGENDTYTLTVDCYEKGTFSGEDVTNDPNNFYKRVKIVLQDHGIQNYAQDTGNPVHRYMVLSMDTVDTEQEVPEDIELD